MPQTPDSSSSPYLSVDEFLSFKDVRMIAQLSVDDGTQPTAADLESNARVAAILMAVSGEVESALLASERYAAADLSSPNGASASYLKLIISKLAYYELCQARPIPPSEATVADYEQAQEQLKQLSTGERILSFVESEKAGIAEDEFMSSFDFVPLNRFTDRLTRVLGLGNDQRRTYKH